jgi:hypothetical protein
MLPQVVAPTPAAAAVCKSRSFTVIGRDVVLPMDAWKFTANVTWCYSTGTKPHLVSAKWGESGKTLCCGWDYRGVSGDERSGCVGYDTCHWAFRRVTGHFAYCPAGLCVAHQYPYIQFTVRDDGTYSLGWG